MNLARRAMFILSDYAGWVAKDEAGSFVVAAIAVSLVEMLAG